MLLRNSIILIRNIINAIITVINEDKKIIEFIIPQIIVLIKLDICMRY